jgi:hypothetical protein
MLPGFGRELRMSARGLARTPVWTATLILTIALGIASNASVAGLVNGLRSPESDWPPQALAGIDRISQLLRSVAVAVFAIACANVAAFLLARSSARARETAVRVAIGARRPQLVRQVLADSVVISALGATAGAILAFWIGRLLPAWLFEEDARKMTFAGEPVGVAWITGACALVTVVCGLLPLVEMRDDDPAAVIQRENSGPSPRFARFGTTLVTIQMAACMLLIVSAGLLLDGFQSALRAGAGRRLSSPVVASIEAVQTSSKSEMTSSGHRYFEAAERVAREVVSATSIAWTANVPGNRPAWRSFAIEAPAASRRVLTLEREPFTSRTIQGLVLPPVHGRLFGTIDSGACGSVVVSAEAARLIDSGQVVGRAIETADGDWSEIVGVVRLNTEDRGRVFHYTPNSEDDVLRGPADYFVPDHATAPRTTLDVNVVSPNYFEVIGLSLAAGRTFDKDVSGCRVGVVNEEANAVHFGGNAVGTAIIDEAGRRTNIIGVVRSIVLRSAQRAVEPALFLPMQQDFIPRMTMIMETGGASGSGLRELHRRLFLIPGGRQDRIIVKTLDEHLSRTALAPERIAVVLVSASATIALALGMLGLYGVMSEAARRRQREFALRIALGARDGHVISQVVAEGMRLVAAGVVLGLLGSMLVSRWISAIAPIDEPLSRWIWVSAPATLAAAVLIASVFPARKALASDPLAIMRDE